MSWWTNAAVGMRLYKCFKFFYRKLFADGKSELERLCLEPITQLAPTYSTLSWLLSPFWRWLHHYVEPWLPFRLSVFTASTAASTAPTSDSDNESPISSTLAPVTALEIKPSAALMYRFDRSLLFSTQLLTDRRHLESKDSVLSLQDIARSIERRKQFRSDPMTSHLLFQALFRFRMTFRLLHAMNERSALPFDSANTSHEKRLHDLFYALLPHEQLRNRISAQWQLLGFQGKDPATDFRGMGMLGLDQMLFYVKTYPRDAAASLRTSQHPEDWYQWALVGIHLTSFILQLLRSRKLQLYLYLAMDKFTGHWPTDTLEQKQVVEVEGPLLQMLQERMNDFYCVLFYRFNLFWIKQTQQRALLKQNETGKQRRPAILEFNNWFQQFKDETEQHVLSMEDLRQEMK